ncbi:MAG: flagellar biosynthesis regulator FlaF [Hyphomonas sp.]
MQVLAMKAYGEVAKRTASDRQLEFALFMQITTALENLAAPGRVSLSDWADAINRNQQLWTILAADLMLPTNALPDDLKRRLLILSEFVRRTSLKVLAGEEDVSGLIEVNKAIMAGLVPGLLDGQDEDIN